MVRTSGEGILKIHLTVDLSLLILIYLLFVGAVMLGGLGFAFDI